MESTVARQLTKTVMVNVSGLVTPANSNPAATAAAATETAAAFLIEILVKTAIVSGWVLRIRMVNAVSPESALGAATSTATKTRARTTAAHGITALVIAVWCAETLTIRAAARARGVDTVIGTVATEAIAEELAKSSPVTSLTILAKKCARTVPILSAIGKTATNVATWTIAKKRR